jgi:hypothetical protein
MNQGPMVEDWGIKPTAIPTHQLGGMSLNNAKELPKPCGLIGIGDPIALAETADPKTLVVSKGAAHHPDPMKVMRQEGGLPGRLALGHELGDSLVLRRLGLNQSKTLKALDIRDGL